MYCWVFSVYVTCYLFTVYCIAAYANKCFITKKTLKTYTIWNSFFNIWCLYNSWKVRVWLVWCYGKILNPFLQSFKKCLNIVLQSYTSFMLKLLLYLEILHCYYDSLTWRQCIEILTIKFNTYTVYCFLFNCLLFMVFLYFFLLLFPAYFLLFSNYCLLFNVYCLLCTVFYLHFIVFCLLFTL